MTPYWTPKCYISRSRLADDLNFGIGSYFHILLFYVHVTIEIQMHYEQNSFLPLAVFFWTEVELSWKSVSLVSSYHH